MGSNSPRPSSSWARDACHHGGMRTVFEAAAGIDGLRRLAAAWHRRVMADEVVSHAFSHGFHPQHVERLATHWAEALGGPSTYCESYGDETASSGSTAATGCTTRWIAAPSLAS